MFEMEDSISAYISPYFFVFNFIFSLGILTIFLAVLDTHMRTAAARIHGMSHIAHKFTFDVDGQKSGKAAEYNEVVISKWRMIVEKMFENIEKINLVFIFIIIKVKMSTTYNSLHIYLTCRVGKGIG